MTDTLCLFYRWKEFLHFSKSNQQIRVWTPAVDRLVIRCKMRIITWSQGSNPAWETINHLRDLISLVQKSQLTCIHIAKVGKWREIQGTMTTATTTTTTIISPGLLYSSRFSSETWIIFWDYYLWITFFVSPTLAINRLRLTPLFRASF